MMLKKLQISLNRFIKKLRESNMYKPRIAGLTRIRNESLIIKETLDHFSNYCDAGIYVYDDHSEDDTVSICKAHPNVKAVITGDKWDKDREKAEWQNRQAVFEHAKKTDDNIDWFVYFDADERMYVELNHNNLKNFDAFSMMLFDFYITEEDKDRVYNGNLPMLRRFCGPEYRNIVMMFKNLPGVRWHKPDQRIPTLPHGARILNNGLVKHYGKAISVQHWEDTCDYYSKSFPKYAEKWEKRKGKAVHILSDFRRELCTWSEIKDKAILLNK